MPAPQPPCSHSYAGYASRGLGKTMMFSAFIVVLLLGAAFRGDPSADGPATELNHLPTEVPAGCELHVQHARVYTAKIRHFVDDTPVSARVLREKQAALFNIVESHDKFAHEVLANKHYPFDSDPEQRLAERLQENLYTLKQFEQQVADTKLVQPGINISADKILQKLNLVPT